MYISLSYTWNLGEPWLYNIHTIPDIINPAPPHHITLTFSPKITLPSNPVTRKLTAEHTTVTGNDPLVSSAFKK